LAFIASLYATRVPVIGAIAKAVSHNAHALSDILPCINLAHIHTQITEGSIGNAFLSVQFDIIARGNIHDCIEYSKYFHNF
jgi:hypothetical protein